MFIFASKLFNTIPSIAACNLVISHLFPNSTVLAIQLLLNTYMYKFHSEGQQYTDIQWSIIEFIYLKFSPFGNGVNCPFLNTESEDKMFLQ